VGLGEFMRTNTIFRLTLAMLLLSLACSFSGLAPGAGNENATQEAGKFSVDKIKADYVQGFLKDTVGELGWGKQAIALVKVSQTSKSSFCFVAADVHLPAIRQYVSS
jgi:hypothetical protein